MAIFGVLAIAYTIDAHSMSKKSPAPVVEVTPAPAPVPTPKPVEIPAVQFISDIANGSECAKYKFKEYGGGSSRIPKAYLRGHALTYAKALCNPNRPDLKVAGGPLGDANKDVLAHYGITESDRLQAVYTLMVGSAFRESSGIYCMGKDPGASNTSGETCEAGLYQTSYNSRSSNPELPAMFQRYFAGNGGPCFLGDFSEGISKLCTASRLKNWGSGNGVVFQKLSKECPAFATEYAAVMFRVGRKHYGPLNTKAAEYRPECFDMLGQVKEFVKNNQSICPQLL